MDVMLPKSLMLASACAMRFHTYELSWRCMFTLTVYFLWPRPELLYTCSSRGLEKSVESEPMKYDSVSLVMLFMPTVDALYDDTLHSTLVPSTPRGSESGLYIRPSIWSM